MQKFHFQICSIIFPYQGILSKKKSNKKVVLWPQMVGGGIGHFVVGTTQKYHFFYAAP